MFAFAVMQLLCWIAGNFLNRFQFIILFQLYRNIFLASTRLFHRSALFISVVVIITEVQNCKSQSWDDSPLLYCGCKGF